MNNFRRQQLRGGFVTIITALLLVVSVAFSVIGYAASDGTKQQLEAVESRYTTIGVMNDQNAQVFIHEGGLYDAQANTTSWVSNNFVKQEDGSILWDDGTVFYSANVLESVAKDSSQIRMVSRSSILSAHVEGIYGLTSGSQNPLQYRKEIIDTFVNSVFVYDDKLVLTYNYKDGTETLTLQQIESVLSSNLFRVYPPYMKNPNLFPIGSAFGFFVYIKDITY